MSKITHLSPTRIKELLKSPYHLNMYIYGEKKQTDAMIEGNLIDCLLFEPEKFSEKFKVMPSFNCATTKGKTELSNFLGCEYTSKDAMIKNYSLSTGKMIIDSEQLTYAERLANGVKNNHTVVINGLLSDRFEFQKKLEFYELGFKHIGICDAVGNCAQTGKFTIWDLKLMSNCHGAKDVIREIRKNKIDLQLLIYASAYEQKCIEVDTVIIAVDNLGLVTPVRISKEHREYARFDWYAAIKKAKEINTDFEFNDTPYKYIDGYDAWLSGDYFEM